MKHSSRDLLLSSNGTVKHNVIINAEIACAVNMFNYPFAADSCPVAIQAWTAEGELSDSLNKYYTANIIFLHICYYSENSLEG